MAVLTVRNIPDEIKQKLRVQAAQAGISLEQFARNILQQAANDDSSNAYSVMEQAAKYFGKDHGVDLELPEREYSRDEIKF